MMRKRIGIRWKITSGYVFLIACLLVAGVFLNTQINDIKVQRDEIISYDTKMRTMSNRLERHVLAMESSLHRYLITSESRYLEAYYENAGAWKTTYEELEGFVQTYSTRQENLDYIYRDIEEWIATIAQPLEQAIRANNREEMIEAFNGEQSSEAISDLQLQFTEFRNVETEAIANKIVELNATNERLTTSLFFALGFIGILAVLIFNTISRRVVTSITDVTEALHNIEASNGKGRKRLVATTNDEMKDLVDATNALLTTMENRQWLQQNLADVLLEYQGIEEVSELGQTLLKSLTTRTRSVYGTFYMQDAKDATKYVKLATFAEAGHDIGRTHFHIGEGLIGQSVLEGRALSYENRENGFRFVETALGDIQVVNGLIVPIMFEKQVVAVMELAAIQSYTAQHRALINEVVERVGVTINSIQNRLEITRLLTASQLQTEELQAQSEELQTQSEELQMQTEELTAINEQLEERTKDAEQKARELQVIQVELEQSAEQLRQSSNYKSEFLANMSHELRTPLNSILILSEMLAENADNRLEDEELEYATIIHKSGEDLLALINDILDLSKVEAGKMDVWFSETDLRELPQHLESMFTPVAQQKNLQFHVNITKNVATPFHTDVKRFQQICNNLISNALKFTEEGSVRVKITAPPVTEQMQEISEQWIALSVTDTGIGVEEQKQELIFESFQQVDGATMRKYGGTGLGLSICREFTKLLGGWITLQSEVGVGSTFTVYIPSLPQGLQRIVEAPTPRTPKVLPVERVYTNEVFNGKTILLVDDDSRNIFALKQALEQKGATIIEAGNGVEALEKLEQHTEIDIILMDIMMPEMDGYEATRYIRQQLQLDLPIIALTAKAMKQDREKAIAVGASDYVTKPLNLEQLFSVLTVWLAKKEHHYG